VRSIVLRVVSAFREKSMSCLSGVPVVAVALVVAGLVRKITGSNWGSVAFFDV
jgi:hypothetical protein